MNATESNNAATNNAAPQMPRTEGWPPTPTPEQERAWQQATPYGNATGAPAPRVHPGAGGTYRDAPSPQGAQPAPGMPPHATPRHNPASVQNLATWAVVL
ncbi:MAG: hypothetical protein ACTH31_12150, partial [Pseudoclavibacter sp.]